MEILKDYDLTKLNTFGIATKARFFVEIEKEEEIKEIFNSQEFKNNPKLFLGGGSNILFTKDFDGMVVLNRLKRIEILSEDSEKVLIKAMGGEWWNDLVNFVVDKDFWGIENLALIPGTVGATPVQNIGAYGVELKDILEKVEAYNTENGTKRIFSKEECELGYRDSIFKNKLKGQYFISAVILKLNKNKKENTDYRALQDYLEKNNLEIKSSKDVSTAISEIRKSKLPDPKILGNAGSFFKNVYVTKEKLEDLLEKYPNMPFFKENTFAQASTGEIKIPSGWLIEQCGWKGKRVGKVGVHDKQSLVLINYGGAKGQEILGLANQIIKDVFEKFGLKLIPEVNLI